MALACQKPTGVAAVSGLRSAQGPAVGCGLPRAIPSRHITLHAPATLGAYTRAGSKRVGNTRCRVVTTPTDVAPNVQHTKSPDAGVHHACLVVV